jgi:hypothetical protein
MVMVNTIVAMIKNYERLKHNKKTQLIEKRAPVERTFVTVHTTEMPADM